MPQIILAVFVLGPESARSVILGYSEMTVAAGSNIHFRVKSPASTFTVDWYRYSTTSVMTDKSGTIVQLDSLPFSYPTDEKKLDDVPRYDGYRILLEHVSSKGPFPILPQPPGDSNTYKNGCNWQISCTLDIPENWPSDLYLAKIRDADGSYAFLPVVVRSNTPGSQARTAVIASTNTWQAYNDYGGANFYTCNQPTCSVYSSIVSYDRPLSGTTPAVSGHLSGIQHLLLRFLKSHGIGYEALSDLDLHSLTGGNLRSYYDILILSGHSEYWSEEMKLALETFLNNGGRLINLSGNTMFWKVRFDGNRMEKVVRWRDLIPGGEFGVLGAGYMGGNCCPVCGGFKALRNHWVYAHTAIRTGSFFGADGVNQDQLGCSDGSSGASGWEFDVVGNGSPPPCGNGLWDNCLEMLAKGVNLNYGGLPVGADMYLFHRVRGGYLFAAPSITLTGSLAVDSLLQQTLLNVIEAFRSNSIPYPLNNCCIDRRGDLNGDGHDADIVDLTFAVNFIFRSGPLPACPNESDINGDGRPLNVLDLTCLVNSIFKGGEAAGTCPDIFPN